MREQALTPPRLPGLLLALLCSLSLLLLQPSPSSAAEVLQVRGATLLQIGDGNRSYALQLACLQVDPADAEPVQAWLRRELPRRTRINLRPMAPVDGRIVARVTRLGDGEDLSTRLIAAGLASADLREPACAAPAAPGLAATVPPSASQSFR